MGQLPHMWHPHCYGLNTHISQNSYVEILTPKTMVLGGGASENWLGLLTVQPSWMGVCLIKGVQESSFALPTMWDMARRCAQSMNCKEGSNQILDLPVPWSWTLQPPELWEINFCSLWATQFMVFLLQQPKWTSTLTSEHEIQRQEAQLKRCSISFISRNFNHLYYIQWSTRSFD